MTRKDSNTRRHIIEVTAQLLVAFDSAGLRIGDIAKESDVGVQTIYYHFNSRDQLIAEAQVHAFQTLNEPLEKLLELTEESVAERNELLFWQALGDYLMLAWSLCVDHGLKLSLALNDISKDAETLRNFVTALDVKYVRWSGLVDVAKTMGWVSRFIDTSALVAVWLATVDGRAMFVNPNSITSSSPEGIRNLLLAVSRVSPESPV